MSGASKRKRRCSECGTMDEFPLGFTPAEVREWCEVCRFHARHALEIDFHSRCAICIAGFWQSRLRALRILFARPELLRWEDR